MIHLVPAQGCVVSPRDFAVHFSTNLSGAERIVLERNASLLGPDAEIPSRLRTPWIAAGATSGGHEERIAVRPSGARSAVWEAGQLQFKGCRPAPEAGDFPFEYLEFGGDRIISTCVPFGVMTAEAVSRELLGHCFCRMHGIPCATTPVCVFAYSSEPAANRFCLVLKLAGGTRAEMFLSGKPLPLSALVSPSADSAVVTGSEVAMEGLNTVWHADRKGRWLAELHFRGGFRGLLNNNLGNDVIQSPPRGSPRFLLCDFDSFHLIPLPSAASNEFLRAFAVQCVVEVVKGSLPILDYVSTKTGENAQRVARQIGGVYRRKSSLWNSYFRYARRKARELAWSELEFVSATERAFESTAFLQASCSVILSDFALDRHRQRRPRPYVPHGTG
jgi:hypothetical protein